MSVGNVARVVAVLAACVAAAGSATSRSSASQNPALANQNGPGAAGGQNSPPPPQQMEPNRALGLWRSTFGAVKTEADNSHGGLDSGSLQGIWVYQRQGQEVIGYFAGNLRGNVLQFRWQEPNDPPLTGEGFMVFDAQGRQYSGRWWSDKRDRVGDWNGWRQPAGQQVRSNPGSQDGGQGYGDAPPPSPYRRPQGYQPQPYQPQPYQQPNQPQPYQPQPNQPQPYPPPQPYQPQTYPPPQPYQPYQRQPAPTPQPAPQPQPTYY